MHRILFRRQFEGFFLLILLGCFLVFPINSIAASPAPISAPEAIYAALERWKNAWQELDTDNYIASYSPRFINQQFSSHENWARARQQRLESQQWIELKLSGIVIFIQSDGRYVANFTQNYKSDSFSEISRKQLLFEKHDNGWLIVAENELEN